MNYIHPKGYTAELIDHHCFLVGSPLTPGVSPYASPILTKSELLDFGFKPEEEKEDWIDKAYNDFNPPTAIVASSPTMSVFYREQRQAFRQVINKYLPK